jgi:hypothetical protein
MKKRRKGEKEKRRKGEEKKRRKGEKEKRRKKEKKERRKEGWNLRLGRERPHVKDVGTLDEVCRTKASTQHPRRNHVCWQQAGKEDGKQKKKKKGKGGEGLQFR